MSDLKSILDLHAAATPGPHQVEVIDDHRGRHDSKTWHIRGLARERYGDNSVHFGEDEATARFVAATFTAVPLMAARLQKVEKIIEDMEHLVDRNDVVTDDFVATAADLRKALELGPHND